MSKKKNNATIFKKDRLLVFLRLFGRWFLLPALLYLVIFFILQPHYISNFSRGFYIDAGDGFQGVWNIWWVHYSLAEHGQNPYFTTMLHWPHGITLIPQTMNIFNCLLAIPLIDVLGLSLVETTNTIIVFSFVFGGVTMFWLIQKLYNNYLVSLIGGVLFTFSTYHFAHAIGHLQLVSFEFIPLFLLTFIILLERPRYRYAILASLGLFLVLLCDYYYLVWSVMLGSMLVAWRLYTKELKLNPRIIKVFSVFVVSSAILIGPLVFALFNLTRNDPLSGFHNPYLFSLDPVSVFLPGGTWYWGELTKWHWEHLSYGAETSIFFGYGLLTVLAVGFYRLIKRKPFKQQPKLLYFWWIVLFIFGVLALGPRFMTFGHTYHLLPLPYALLEAIFPTLKLSGVPVRWVLVSLIAAIIIACFILSRLDMKKRRGKILICIFIFVSAVDLRPAPLPLTPPQVKPYVYEIKDLPGGAVIDNAALSGEEQLYHQTIHEHPMAFGYVTRTPQSVEAKDFLIFAALEQGRHKDLCKLYKVRYVTTPRHRPLKTTFPVIYKDRDALIYDMKNSNNC